MLIDGIHVPLTEPFYRDGTLYLRKLEHNIRRYSLSPVSGVVALPPDGEASGLSDREAREVLHAVGETAAREKVLVAGVVQDSVHGALNLAEAAHTANFDALLVAPPRNWRSMVRGEDAQAVTLFFHAVADAAPLPVLLWSGESDGGFRLPVSMIAELAKHANIVGVYAENLTPEQHAAIAAATSERRYDAEVTTIFAPVTRRMKTEISAGPATFVSAEALGGGTAVATAPPKPGIKTRTKTVGFQIMAAGKAAGLGPLFEAGVSGAMPNLAASAPQAVYEVFAAFKDGDSVLSAEKAARLQAADGLIEELGISGTKYGCDLNGYFGGLPRLPRLPLNAEQRARIDAAFRELKS